MPLVGEWADWGEGVAWGVDGFFTHSVDLNLPRSAVFAKAVQVGYQLSKSDAGGAFWCGLVKSETVNQTVSPQLEHHFFLPLGFPGATLVWADTDVIGVTFGLAATSNTPGRILGRVAWTLGFWE